MITGGYRGALLVLTVAGLVLAVAFLSRYLMLTRWWRSVIGWHMAAFSLLNAELFAYMLWRLLVPTRSQAAWVVTLVVVGQFVALLAWRLAVLEREQWRSRQEAEGGRDRAGRP